LEFFLDQFGRTVLYFLNDKMNRSDMRFEMVKNRIRTHN